MPDSNLSTSIAAVKTKITTDAPTATVDEILSLARAAKSVGLSEDAAVESAINSRVLTLSSGATTANMVKLSNAIKQMRDVTAASGSSSSVDLTAVSTNIIPDTDVTYDLGSATHKFKDLYLDGNTLNLGNQTIKATATGIELPELTIGSGTNKVKLTAKSDGTLEQVGTDSSGTTKAAEAIGGSGGGSSVTVSDTAPTSPSAGDMWYDSSILQTFVYYNDGSSSQWVPASPQQVGPAGPAGTDGAAGAAGSSGSSVTAYANLAAFSSSGNTNGDIAYANDTNGVYMWSNSSWKRMSIGSNSGPIFTTIPPTTLQLSNDGTSTVNITAAAIDEGAFPVTYDWDAYNGTTLYNASSLPPQVTAVTQSGGSFTLTGSNTTSNTGGFSFRSKASDGVTTTTAITTCNLAFLGDTLLRTQSSPNPGASDFFGYAVAISDSYYSVSAMYEDPGSVTNTGRVYIFNRSDGSLKHTLENPNAENTGDMDAFARAIDMNDTYTIMGTHTEDYGSYLYVGVVYVFNTSTGALLHTHQPPLSDRSQSNLFYGRNVIMSDTHFITGMAGHTASGGKAFVYNLSTNALVYTITNPNSYGTAGGDQFSYGIGISDTYFAVGASHEDSVSYTDTGVVSVYNMSDGSLRHTIPNPSPTGISNEFGYALAMTDTHLVVSEHGHIDGNGNVNAGKVHVYNPDTGALRYTITNPNTVDPAEDDFGQGIQVSTNYIMANAPDYQDGATTVGRVYIFNISDGSLLHTILAPTATADNWGAGSRAAAIDLHETQFIVGAYGADVNGVADAGRAYIYN